MLASRMPRHIVSRSALSGLVETLKAHLNPSNWIAHVFGKLARQRICSCFGIYPHLEIPARHSIVPEVVLVEELLDPVSKRLDGCSIIWFEAEEGLKRQFCNFLLSVCLW